MGEYIKHPTTGAQVKVGVCCGNACDIFFSRDQILAFKREGYRGFYAGDWDHTLDRILHNPNSLYKLPEECTFKPDVHTVIFENNDIEHDTVIVQKKGNRGSVYTWIGLPCKQKDAQKVYAVIIGERYDKLGRGRTIFKCDCCGKPFSITKDEAEKIKAKHPYWAKWIKPHPNS